jgi:CRISPR-associated protein Cmr3
MAEHVLLRLRDGFTITDARGFNVGGGAPARSLPWPLPSTVAGALRAAIGHLENFIPVAEGDHSDRGYWESLLTQVHIRGPVAVQARYVGAELEWKALWPAPRDAMFYPAHTSSTAPELRRLDPKPTTRTNEGARSLGPAERLHDALRGLWWPTLGDRRKPLEMPAWWTHEDFTRWLRAPDTTAPTRVRASESRLNVRVNIDPATGAARDGALFAHDTREVLVRDAEHDTCDETAIVAEISEPIDGAVRFGGVGRVASIEAYDGAALAPPIDLFSTAVTRLRLVLVTPGAFTKGWLPDWLEAGDRNGNPVFVGTLPGTRVTAVLRAAILDRAVPLSGWDLAKRGPKPSRRLVPSGAVYFVELDEALSPTEATKLWLRSMQRDDSAEARDGFGLMVPGVWPAMENT